MALLRAVGDAKTEDGYTKALMALQKSHVDVETHLLAHPCICARTNGEVSWCEYLN